MKQSFNRIPAYILRGEVIYGKGIGKLVGMPTANLQIACESILPPVGVYVTEVVLNQQLYYGVTNVGTSPTIDNDEKVSVETHILNFNGTIYGNSVEIRLFEKLRAQKKFDNFSMLLEQISMDCVAALDCGGV